MDKHVVYAKTPLGDEAVRQRTRVVQRNLRMVLVQVDGKLSIAELAEKLGNPRLVENALHELTEGGFILPVSGPVKENSVNTSTQATVPMSLQASALSQFSTFGPKSIVSPDSQIANNFSSFGKPIQPAAGSDSPAASAQWGSAPPLVELGKKGSVFKWLFGIAFVVFLVALLVAVFYPYDTFRPRIESNASLYLQMPVKVGRVTLVFWPKPQLRLQEITLGDAGDSTIDEIRIDSPQSMLGGGPFELSKIDVLGATLPINRLLDLPVFQSAAVAGRPDFAIRQIHLERGNLAVRDLTLRDVGGDINLGSDGGFESASLLAEGRALRIQATPGKQGIALNIEGSAWRPGGTAVIFDGLQAKGLLYKDTLFIENFDTSLLGGVVKGNWLFDWSNGLAMSGDANLTRLDGARVSSAFAPSVKLAGELGGALRWRSNGGNWENMWRSLEAKLDGEVMRGTLYGVDLGEASRRGDGSPVRAGSTKFDRLTAMFKLTPTEFEGQGIEMDAGMMKASGSFKATRQGQVEGSLAVILKTSVSTLRVPIRVSGTLPELLTVVSK